MKLDAPAGVSLYSPSKEACRAAKPLYQMSEHLGQPVFISFQFQRMDRLPESKASVVVKMPKSGNSNRSIAQLATVDHMYPVASWQPSIGQPRLFSTRNKHLCYVLSLRPNNSVVFDVGAES